MENFIKEEIQELLSIIPKNYPLQDIYYLTDSCDIFAEELNQLCQSQGYIFDLMIPDCENFEEITNNTELKIHKFYYNKNRYNRQSKVYDFVFVSIDLEKIEEIDIFYKKLYAINKNGGKVLFFLNNNHNLRDLEDILIEKNYVAVNPITDTFKNYKILSAQKMHGWDN